MSVKSLIVFSLSVPMLFITGCMSTGARPESFIQGQASGWKSIELNDIAIGNYDVAWQKTVDTIARNYDIEMMDKESGYLRTGWTYGISGGALDRYRGRLTVKYPDVRTPKIVEIKTEAQWLSYNYGSWQSGWDQSFQRDIYTALSGRLGRTVSNN